MSGSNGASLNLVKGVKKMGIIVNKSESRAYTNALQDAIDNGYLSTEMVLQEMLHYLGENVIEDFCKNNEMFGCEFLDEDSEDSEDE